VGGLGVLDGFGVCCGMQGVSRSDRQLLDTAALCGHLVPAGSVYALLAEHRKQIFPDQCVR
jgi:hypothetical protein